MSFRGRFRRQQQQQPAASSLLLVNSKNKRDSISRFLRHSSSSSSTTTATTSSALLQHHSSPLAPFDACIEACDALAASSSVTTTRQQIVVPPVSEEEKEDREEAGSNNNNNNNAPNDMQRNNNTTSNHGLLDCSVLVSPDGALLFTSQQTNDIDLCGTTTVAAAANNEHNTDNNNINNSNHHGNKYPWTKTSTEHRDGVILEEEYESAVICGNDLHPSGDYAANGFSARGWDCDAATLALRTSCDVLKMMEQFVEELALCRKEEAARVLGTCSSLSLYRERLLRQNNDNVGSTQRRRGNNNNNNNNNKPNRVGPLLSSGTDLGTNISVALETMEEYFSTLAETDSQHWRNVCLESSTTRNDDVSSSSSPSTSDGNNTNTTAPFRGMLPKIRDAAIKANIRASQREKALNDIRMKVTEAQNILLKQKEWAANQWKRVQNEDDKIDRLLVERREEQQQHYLMNEQRQRDVVLLDRTESEPDISEDVWELVKGVAAMEDFGHTGYSPRVNQKGSTVIDSKNGMMTTTPPHLQINRVDIEKESEIQDIRMVALAADESVEDASSQLLNIMSKQDTTMRAARIAAESCLLSECNALHKCLRSLVAIERTALEERARKLQMLETAVDAIDVRKDIDIYIQNDKHLPGGCSRAGDDDDGGVAAALAVLNSHVEGGTDSKVSNIERPNYFEGWGGDVETDHDDTDDVEPELFGEVISMLFDGDQRKNTPRETEPDSPSPRRGKRERTLSESYELKKEEKVALVAFALEEKTKRGQSFRQTILYELNNQRSKKTEVEGEANFESLCRLFDSFLTGCGREAIDVGAAKMAMILSQTFFFVDQNDDNEVDDDRENRVYVKNKISHHSIWADDEFWDHALEQCVAESLQKSGVLMNYVKTAPNKNIKWHDLAPSEYADAAAQVHSVVFAQLGTLAHSMLEMDISDSGLSRSCNFVRRLSIRYQLPLNLRITLLNHLQNNS
jgi:hypothetical protein